MNPAPSHPLERITPFVVALAIAIASLCFLLGSVRLGLGAIAGGVLSVTNWYALRWIVRQLHAADDAPRSGLAALMFLVAFKMAAVGAAAWIAIRMFDLDVIGFAFGFSALVMGLVLGGLMTQSEMTSGQPVSSRDDRKESY